MSTIARGKSHPIYHVLGAMARCIVDPIFTSVICRTQSTDYAL